LIKKLEQEAGYSLVEVMASIIILSLAILPMVGMFDMGLRTATTGSNYDKSRALANLKLEEAKSLPFASLQDNFPVAGSTPDSAGYYDSGFIPASAPFTNFQYRIEKQYMKKPDTSSTEFEACDPSSTDPNIGCSPGTNLMRITVTVQWADGNEYHTLGLVSA
jgi:Tfp pilus assembly protein PilV